MGQHVVGSTTVSQFKPLSCFISNACTGSSDVCTASSDVCTASSVVCTASSDVCTASSGVCMSLTEGNRNCPYTAEMEATQQHEISSLPYVVCRDCKAERKGAWLISGSGHGKVSSSYKLAWFASRIAHRASP